MSIKSGSPTLPTDGLALLRKPFPAHQISKLPKPKSKDAPKGRCQECGGWHGLPAIHLDYVGHAALTDRLLDADPAWSWEPLAIDEKGLPALDKDGGMWIKLTICGVTRLGYGDAQGKMGGDATKERIGDALRNAAMRFGAALDLWHKGELHLEEEPGKATISATDGAGETLDEMRRNELENLALDLVDWHRDGKDLRAIEVWYASDTWATDTGLANDERIYVWHLLKPESKLRAAIKANQPALAEEAAKEKA